MVESYGAWAERSSLPALGRRFIAPERCVQRSVAARTWRTRKQRFTPLSRAAPRRSRPIRSRRGRWPANDRRVRTSSVHCRDRLRPMQIGVRPGGGGALVALRDRMRLVPIALRRPPEGLQGCRNGFRRQPFIEAAPEDGRGHAFPFVRARWIAAESEKAHSVACRKFVSERQARRRASQSREA